MNNDTMIRITISGRDAWRYFSFSGTVPPVTENIPSKVIKPTISMMKVKVEVGFIILVYSSSLSLHVIEPLRLVEAGEFLHNKVKK